MNYPPYRSSEFLNTFEVLPDQNKISEMIHREFKKYSKLSDKVINDIKEKVNNDYKKNHKVVDFDLLKKEINEICGNITDDIFKMEECAKQADKTMKELKQNIEQAKDQKNIISYFDKTLKNIKNAIRSVQNSPIANALFAYYVTEMMSGMFAAAAAESVSPDKNPIFISEKNIDMWSMKVNDVSLYFYLSLNNLYSHFAMTRAETMQAVITNQDLSCYVTGLSSLQKELNRTDCIRDVAIYANLEKFIKEIKKYKPFEGVGLPDLSKYLSSRQKNFNDNKCGNDIKKLSAFANIEKNSIPEFLNKHDSLLGQKTTSEKTTKTTSKIMSTLNNVAPNDYDMYDYFEKIEPIKEKSTTTQSNHDQAITTTLHNDDYDSTVDTTEHKVDNTGFAKIIMSALASSFGVATIGAAATLGSFLAIEKFTRKSIYDMLFCGKKKDLDNTDVEMQDLNSNISKLERRRLTDNSYIVRI